MLFKTENGQQLMAQWGWSIARTDAYVILGKELVDQAYYTRALSTLQIAVDREPENVDALILMAQAYTELGRIDEAKPFMNRSSMTLRLPIPSAYRNLIKIYQDEGYHAEALELMKKGAENTTGTQEFDVMLREYTPVAPTFSVSEGRYTSEIDVTISVPDNETVYYTTDGTDPLRVGTHLHCRYKAARFGRKDDHQGDWLYRKRYAERADFRRLYGHHSDACRAAGE